MLNTAFFVLVFLRCADMSNILWHWGSCILLSQVLWVLKSPILLSIQVKCLLCFAFCVTLNTLQIYCILVVTANIYIKYSGWSQFHVYRFVLVLVKRQSGQTLPSWVPDICGSICLCVFMVMRVHRSHICFISQCQRKTVVCPGSRTGTVEVLVGSYDSALQH